MSTTPGQRAKVFKDTLSHFRGMKFKFDRYSGLINDYVPSQRYNADFSLRIINQDCLEVSKNMVSEGEKTACLNMASDYISGGGVRSGRAITQEEEICRCSALMCALPSKTKQQTVKRLPYLNIDDIVYSKDIPVIKHGFNEDYMLRQAQFNIDFISCAAIRKPHTDGNQYLDDGDRDTMRGKIKQIIQLADYEKVDNLVLGAFGCGAFANPAPEVAKMFSSELAPFKRSFKNVAFAILERKTTRLCDVFSSVFGIDWTS